MPTVPRYDVPTATPQDIPDIRRDATAQTFGAGIGQAVAGVGQAIERGGDVLAQNALRMQTLANQAEADEGTFKWNIAQGELDSQQRALEGKARADAYPEYVRKTTELRQKFANSMSNPESQRLFNTETRRFAAYSLRNEAAGVGTALRQENTKANQNLLTMSTLSVQANPDNPAVYSEALGVAQRAARQESENLRESPDSAALRQQQVESELLTARIAALAGDKPIEASKLYEENKAKIFPQDRSRIESAINSGNQKIMGQGALVKHGIGVAMNSNLDALKATGIEIPSAPTREAIKATHGPVAADVYEDERINAQIYYENTKNLPIMTSAQMDAARRRLTPSPSSSQENRRFQMITEAFDKRLELRKNDPALSVEDSAAIKDLLKKVDVGTEAGFKQLMALRLSQQALAGIDPTMRSPGTNAEILPIIAPLDPAALLPGSEQQVFARVKKDLIKKFGPREEDWKAAFNHGLYVNRFAAPAKKVIRDFMLSLEPTSVPGASSSDRTPAAQRQRQSTKAADFVIEVEDLPGAVDEMGNRLVGPPTVVDKRSPSKYILDENARRTK